MPKAIAWIFWGLGVAHLIYGALRYREPLRAALVDGYINQFAQTEVRRTAFWFMAFGPLLMLAGHTLVHAVSTGDLALVRIIGWYQLVIGLAGLAAFPKSPFIVATALAPLVLCVGYGVLT
jgi:hypothetical protein